MTHLSMAARTAMTRQRAVTSISRCETVSNVTMRQLMREAPASCVCWSHDLAWRWCRVDVCVLITLCYVYKILRTDFVHILAFQTLKFSKKRLRQSNNTTLYKTFMCFSKERHWLIDMVLLKTHSRTNTDSVGILKCKVLGHFSSICAAREVTEWLIVFF